MEQLKSLTNEAISDETKAKMLNEISEHFDSVINSEGNQAMIECYLNVFLNYLKTTPIQFFSESPSQKVQCCFCYIAIQRLIL